MHLILCLRQISEEMEDGQIPKLGGFNDTGFVQARAVFDFCEVIGCLVQFES